MKINIHAMRMQMSPEQIVKFDDMLMKNQDANDSLKILKKDYKNLKINIQRIEKKRLRMIEELPADDRSFTPNWIRREIGSIEKKYVGIEKGIKNCNNTQREFNRQFKSFATNWNYNFENRIQGLNNISSRYKGDTYVSNDCIRITKRYFKNITSAFASHERLKQIYKANDLRKAALAKENPQS